MEHSLIIHHKNQVVFTSNEHWLYPLFELEDFMKKQAFPPEELYLHDKIAGKAAAALIVRLGIRKCYIELLSERAIPIFEKHGVAFEYNKKVEHIQCRTEDLISSQMSIEDIYLFLRKRAGRVQGLALKVDHLTVDLDHKNILENLNLEVNRGEQLIISGANGAGKTTLLRAILGYIPIVSGTVQLGNMTVGSREWKNNRSMIGYVHQEAVKNNFPISAGEVAAIGLSGRRLRKKESDYRVELAMRRTGCFQLFNQSYHSLSGGEKQRVSLSRCLLQNARILLFDEPTSFLDSKGKAELLTLLQELSRTEAPTILLVSHETSWLEQLDWPCKELREGKLW